MKYKGIFVVTFCDFEDILGIFKVPFWNLRNINMFKTMVYTHNINGDMMNKTASYLSNLYKNNDDFILREINNGKNNIYVVYFESLSRVYNVPQIVINISFPSIIFYLGN